MAMCACICENGLCSDDYSIHSLWMDGGWEERPEVAAATKVKGEHMFV